MAHSTAVHAAVPTLARDLLYKADHARAIDRHIDFFGDGELSNGTCDGRSDLFLESLA
jgi:hypothetical protein